MLPLLRSSSSIHGERITRQALHRRFLSQQSTVLLVSAAAPDNIILCLSSYFSSTTSYSLRTLWRLPPFLFRAFERLVQAGQGIGVAAYSFLMATCTSVGVMQASVRKSLSLYLYSPFRTALFPHFSHEVLGGFTEASLGSEILQQLSNFAAVGNL